MTKKILIITIILNSLSSNSQNDFDIQWSNPRTFSDKAMQPIVIHYDSNFVYIEQSPSFSSDSIFIEKTSLKTLEVVSVFDIGKILSKNKSKLKKLYFLKNQYLLFTELKTEKSIDLYAQYFDTNGIEVSTKTLLMSESIIGGFFYILPEIFAFYDKNSENIKVYVDLANKRKQNEVFKVKIFDSNLNQIFENKIELDVQDKLFKQIYLFFDNKNNTFNLLGQRYANAEDMRSDVGSLELITLDTKLGITTSKTLLATNKQILKIEEIISLDTIYFTGIYSRKSNTGPNNNGTFSFKYNYKTNEVSKASFTNFTKQDIDKLNNPSITSNTSGLETLQTSLPKLPTNYMLKDIILTSTNDWYYIFEYQTFLQYSGYGTISSEYIFNDVFILKTSFDGKVIWSYVLPKRQELQTTSVFNINKGLSKESKYANMLSVAPILYKDELYLIYNDLKSNLLVKNVSELKKIKITKKEEESENICLMIKIDKNDNITKKVLFENQTIGQSASIYNSVQISANKWLFFVSNKQLKNRSIGILKL